jgi:hypothetical protein
MEEARAEHARAGRSARREMEIRARARECGWRGMRKLGGDSLGYHKRKFVIIVRAIPEEKEANGQLGP